jgi:hypothetical protein
MESLFIAGSYERQVKRLYKQQKHNPNDNYGFSGYCMKGIAFVEIRAPPGAGGGTKGIRKRKEMNDDRQNGRQLGKNKCEGSHGGNKVQNEIIGYQPAPEGFPQWQLPKPKLFK